MNSPDPRLCLGIRPDPAQHVAGGDCGFVLLKKRADFTEKMLRVFRLSFPGSDVLRERIPDFSIECILQMRAIVFVLRNVIRIDSNS